MNLSLPDDVIEAYAFANTPAYLFRRLQPTAYVADLQEETQERLIAMIDECGSHSDGSKIAAYAALVALLCKADLEQTSEFIRCVEGLEWGNALCLISKQVTPSTQIHSIGFPLLEAQVGLTRDPVSTSFVKIGEKNA